MYRDTLQYLEMKCYCITIFSIRISINFYPILLNSFSYRKIIITTKRELGCVCLLVFVYYHTTFHSYGDITITDERLQILTYARHSWPLSIEDSLACHNYCDTEHPFIMVISKYPWHSHLLPSVCSWAVTTCFYDSGLSRLGFEHPTSRLKANAITHRRGWQFWRGDFNSWTRIKSTCI